MMPKRVLIQHEHTLCDINKTAKWYFEGTDPQSTLSLDMIEEATNTPNFFRNAKIADKSLYTIRKFKEDGHIFHVFSNTHKQKTKTQWLKKILGFKGSEIKHLNKVKEDDYDMIIYSDSTIPMNHDFKGIRVLFDPIGIHEGCKLTYDYYAKDWNTLNLLLLSDRLTRIEERIPWYEKDNRN